MLFDQMNCICSTAPVQCNASPTMAVVVYNRQALHLPINSCHLQEQQTLSTSHAKYRCHAGAELRNMSNMTVMEQKTVQLLVVLR